MPAPPVTRRARLWEWADDRRVPLQAILVTVGVVVAHPGGGKDRLQAARRDPAHGGGRVHRPAAQPAGRRVAAGGGLAPGLCRHHRDACSPLLVFTGLAYAFGAPLANGLTHLISKLPNYVKQRRARQGVHRPVWCASTTCSTGSSRTCPSSQSYAKNLSKPALKLGAGAFTLGFDLFVVFILVLLLLLEGPKLRARRVAVLRPRDAPPGSRASPARSTGR